MFGDNLSFISDTTIAATQSLEVEMKDKFKQNFKIALPAAIGAIFVLLYQGFHLGETVVLEATGKVDFVKIIPYLLVIVLDVSGMNVFTVLFAGIIAAGIIGISSGELSVLDVATLSYEGFTGMTEIFLLSMLMACSIGNSSRRTSIYFSKNRGEDEP